MELVHRRRDAVVAVAGAEILHAGTAESLRSELGPEVSEAFLRVPHSRDEVVEEHVVEPGRRDDDAFVRERVGEGRHAAGLDPADVGVVGARDGESERGARDERDVGKMSAAGVGVVEHEGVVRPGAFQPDGGDGVRHGSEVNGDVLGLGDQASAGVEERGRAVAALLDVGGEGRADEGGAHLLGDGTQGAA